MIQPNDGEILAAIHDTTTKLIALGRADLAGRAWPVVWSPDFTDGPLMVRAAVLAVYGAGGYLRHRHEQATMRETALAVREGWTPGPGPARFLGPPRRPARCDDCHHRIPAPGVAA